MCVIVKYTIFLIFNSNNLVKARNKVHVLCVCVPEVSNCLVVR